MKSTRSDPVRVNGVFPGAIHSKARIASAAAVNSSAATGAQTCGGCTDCFDRVVVSGEGTAGDTKITRMAYAITIAVTACMRPTEVTVNK